MENLSEKNIIEPCNDNCSFCFLNYADILGENYLFKNLSPFTIGKIIKEVHHQVKKYSKGDLIASIGDEYNSLIIIVKGSVVGEIIDFEGKVLRIEELKAPDTVASLFIFGDNHYLPVNITALSETQTLIIHRQDLLMLFRSHETVLHNYLNIMANRAQHLSKQIKLHGFHTIKGKVAHYLLEQLKKHNKSEFIIPNTQSQLAEMFGVARPSIARTMKEMTSKNIIQQKGKYIKIMDKQALSALLR